MSIRLLEERYSDHPSSLLVYESDTESSIATIPSYIRPMDMGPGSRVYILEYAHMSLTRELDTWEWIVHRVEHTLYPTTLSREERVTQCIVILSDAERSLMSLIRHIYHWYDLSTIGSIRFIDHREESCMEMWIADRLHLSLARSDRGIHTDEEKYILS